MATILIDGKSYTAVETLPYHGMGCRAKVVQDGERERIAVNHGGGWEWHILPWRNLRAGGA